MINKDILRHLELLSCRFCAIHKHRTINIGQWGQFAFSATPNTLPITSYELQVCLLKLLSNTKKNNQRKRSYIIIGIINHEVSKAIELA